MKTILDDAGMRHKLLEQVNDIFPSMRVEEDGDTVRIMNDKSLLIGFTGTEEARKALGSGFLAGLVKGFNVAMLAIPDVNFKSDN